MSGLRNHWKTELAPLLYPKRVAVVGATESAGPGRAVTKNVLAGWGDDDVFLVSRTREEVLGRRTYRSLSDLPDAPDLVIAATSADAAVSVAEDAGALGSRALMVLSAGFADSSQQAGRELQRALRSTAERLGLLVCGPNSIGIANVEERRYLWTSDAVEGPSWLGHRNVAIVSQSGGLLISALKGAEAVQLPLRVLVSSGNEAVIQLEDYCEFLLGEPEIGVLAVIVESFGSGDRWRLLASAAAARGVRVVALKVGLSERGGRAVTAHTGRLAGEGAVAQRVLRSLGFVVVESVDELVAGCTVLSRYPDYRPGRVAFLMVSGGTAALVADVAQRQDVPLANFSPETDTKLRSALPDYGTVANPLDTTGGRTIQDRKIISTVGAAILDDPGVDSIVVVAPLDPAGRPGPISEFVDVVAGLRRGEGKPVVMASTLSGSVGAWMTVAGRTGIPFVEDITTWLRFLGHLCQADPPFGPGVGQDAELPRESVPAPVRHLDELGGVPEDVCYELLKACDLQYAPYEIVHEYGELASVAGRVGYPAVMKFVSPDLPHKSARGLLRLPLGDLRALQDAYRDLSESAGAQGLRGKLLIQRFVDSGFEFMLGMKRDPVFGAVVILGWGGVWAEIVDDWALLLPPVTEGSVLRVLHRLKAYRGLAAASPDGQAKVDGLAAYVCGFARLCAGLPARVTAFEINPLMVLRGGEVCAVDALIELDEQSMEWR